MSTRYASGGTDNPFVTRTVLRQFQIATGYLADLRHLFTSATVGMFSMIRMHERNRAWVDAIKTYERYMEEFAADDNYPFEEHEDAPGIPDLRASVDLCASGPKAGTEGHPPFRKLM